MKRGVPLADRLKSFKFGVECPDPQSRIRMCSWTLATPGLCSKQRRKKADPNNNHQMLIFICRDSPQGFFFTRRYEGRDRDCVRLLNRTAHKFQSKTSKMTSPKS